MVWDLKPSTKAVLESCTSQLYVYMMGTALEKLGRLLLRYFSKCSSQLKLVFTELLKFNSEAKERMLIHSLFDLKGGTMIYYKPDNLSSSLSLGSNYYMDIITW